MNKNELEKILIDDFGFYLEEEYNDSITYYKDFENFELIAFIKFENDILKYVINLEMTLDIGTRRLDRDIMTDEDFKEFIKDVDDFKKDASEVYQELKKIKEVLESHVVKFL